MVKNILLIVFILVTSPIYGEDLMFIVGSKSPINRISKKDVKSIFIGEKTKWSDGQKIVVIDYKRGVEIKNTFCRSILKISQIQLYKKCIKASLLGKGSKLVLISSKQEAIDLISKEPRAIGYLGQSETIDNRVKIIKVGQ